MYTDHVGVCVSVCVHTCVCESVRGRERERVHKHEKQAIPFANIDMGVPIQSCYKDYCLLRSHFIRLKHTPSSAHRASCSGWRLLASLLGWLGGSSASGFTDDHCSVLQSVLQSINTAYFKRGFNGTIVYTLFFAHLTHRHTHTRTHTQNQH